MNHLACIIYQGEQLVHSCYHLENYIFYKRSTMREVIDFLAKELGQQTQRTGWMQKDEYYVYWYHSAVNDRRVVIVCDDKPNEKIAINKLHRLVNDANLIADKTLSEPDRIQAIQEEMLEIKEVLYDNIEKLLARGQRLETLIEKSDQLSLTSKAFLKKSKDLNRCCNLL